MSDGVSTERQRLIAVAGVPGVGKSTVAALIADRISADHLRTDEIRKALFNEPAYTDDETNTVYQTMRDRADTRLATGGSVVLDATFAAEEDRHAVRELAADRGAAFQIVRVVCDQSVLTDRINERDGISDADLTVSREFRTSFDPIELPHDRIDNSGSLSATRDQVQALF